MKIRLDHPVTLAAAGFLFTAALLGAAQAHGQVIRIADGGRVRTRAGAGVASPSADDIAGSSRLVAARSEPTPPAMPAA